VLKQIEEWFSLPNLGGRDIGANDFADAFSFSQTPPPPSPLPTRMCPATPVYPTPTPTATPTPVPGKAEIYTAPSSLAFNPVIVGLKGAAQSLALENLSTTDAVTIHHVSISHPKDFTVTDSCPAPPATLAPAASCTITTAFNPVKSGTFKGKLTIKDSATNSPQKVSLSAYGAPLPALVTLKVRKELNFHRVKVGDTKTKKLTIRNSNSDKLPVPIESIGISGDFSETNDCPASLPDKAKCEVEVTFQPTAAGADSGTITISYSSGISQQQIVQLNGTGR
jgi:hypothetical protein